MSADSPPGSPALRASDAEREHHVELLREHAGEGRLSLDELSERLDRAYAARTRGELTALLEDLPATRVPAERRGRAVRARHDLRGHVVAYALVNLLLVGVWAATGADYFWPIWPILGWGIGVASHASETLRGRPLLGAGCSGRSRSRSRAPGRAA